VTTNIAGILRSNRQRWATVTLKIASLQLSLFAENNSSATHRRYKNSSELSLPLFATASFGELSKFVLFCRRRVYFTLSP